MITVKGSSWKKEDYRFMADVIVIGMSEACIDYERNCSKCPSKLACQELLKTEEFCERLGYYVSTREEFENTEFEMSEGGE